MTYIKIFAAIILTSFSVFSQTIRKEITPWGMIRVLDSIFVDDTEITVGEYLECYYYSHNLNVPFPNQYFLPDFPSGVKPDYAFLFYTSTNSSLEYGETATTMGIRKLPFPKDSVASAKNYKSLEERYLHLPITYISYEQAKEYCKWRTMITNQEYETNLIFDLPDENLFNLLNENFDSIRVIKRKPFPSGNYLNSRKDKAKARDKVNNIVGNRALVVASFYPTSKGFYDLQGNVSEMSSKKGESFGGSYIHPNRSSIKGEIVNYIKPEKWLGFRCIARMSN